MMASKNITRAEAITLGLKQYFTGKPCKYGHSTHRYTKGGTCIICSKETAIKNAGKYQLDKEKIRARRASGKYRGKEREWRLANKKKLAKQCREWRKNNKERVKEIAKRFRQKNKEKVNLQIKKIKNTTAEYLFFTDTVAYNKKMKEKSACQQRYIARKKQRESHDA